ncbi:AAA family ATPase [Shumkonia mesophila]|uniref:AAA family ATPase n=1 Tax=Shumkonia mesophila TaxID=2838854 RepID=UPI0029349E8F|nr:AAA family ATPase [Shumkonia mesophila]
MTTSPLKAITLSAFRGASTPFKLEFEKGKRLTLVYGENGTGKTTLCDAFEFLAEGRVGSLEEKGLGAQLDKFWPTVGSEGRAVSVSLETASGSCSGTVQGKKVSVVPENQRPRVGVLRRNQILRIVEAQPAKRYEEIKRFIDIDGVEASEAELKKLIDSLKRRQADCVTALGENLKALDGFYEQAGKPSADSSLAWARARLAAPQQELDANIGAIGKLRSAFQNLDGFPTQHQEAKKNLDISKAALSEATAAVEAAIAQAGSGAGELLDLMQAGAKFLHDHPATATCPLCDSPENIVGLAERLEEKLANFATLTEVNGKLTTCRQVHEMRQHAVASLIERYGREKAAYIDTQSGHIWPAMFKLPTTPPPEDIESLALWLTANEDLSPAWKTIEEEWQGEKRFAVALKRAVDQYLENLKIQKQLETQIPRVEKAHAAIIEERQSFTDKLISGIADDVGDLYEAIHPGEGLKKISLQLDPVRRASLNLGSEFCSQKAPPQAYFSQSHLDTLGLCVFLALALRAQPDQTILVLDDVIGSVDEPHVERVIEAIYEYSQKFRHCIVTTHYRPWREKFRWGWLKNGQCQFVELTGWDLPRGLRVTNSLPELDRLKKLLADASPDVQAICGKSGVILEAALDYLTQKYECSVPRRSGNAYTLGDLLPAIGKKLREALKAEIRDEKAASGAPIVRVVELKPILDELERIAQARNVFGAHFREISFELLEADALKFAGYVVTLMDALTHPEDGWPSSKRSGTHWATSADSRRLHPLIRPS